jgi:DNA (cytosine-5)-methyltransferase 1
MDVIGGIDCWEDAGATYRQNLKSHRCMIADLSNVSPTEICRFFDIRSGEIDVIAGGPPCQGFSTVGKRDGDDPRNKLWNHFRDIVAAFEPKYLLIENVEGLIVTQRGKVRDSIIRAFRGIGYELECRLLKAADFGVPQLRKRTIFLGTRIGERRVEFPEPTMKKHVSVSEAIFDLPALDAGQCTHRYGKSPISEYQRARRKDVEILTHHQAANHPPHLIKLLAHIPDGGNRKSIPDRLQPRSGFHNSYARLCELETGNCRNFDHAKAIIGSGNASHSKSRTDGAGRIATAVVRRRFRSPGLKDFAVLASRQCGPSFVRRSARSSDRRCVLRPRKQK